MFTPPRCPNPACTMHASPTKGFFWPPRLLPPQVPQPSGSALPVPRLRPILLAPDVPHGLSRPQAGAQPHGLRARLEWRRPAAVCAHRWPTPREPRQEAPQDRSSLPRAEPQPAAGAAARLSDRLRRARDLRRTPQHQTTDCTDRHRAKLSTDPRRPIGTDSARRPQELRAAAPHRPRREALRQAAKPVTSRRAERAAAGVSSASSTMAACR